MSCTVLGSESPEALGSGGPENSGVLAGRGPGDCDPGPLGAGMGALPPAVGAQGPAGRSGQMRGNYSWMSSGLDSL